MHLYGTIQKIDAEQRMVWGYASTEAKDGHGEIVLKSAIEGALDDYLEFANIREMHQLSAVGTAEEAFVDDKGMYVCAKVVDDGAWKKIQDKVYKGFSIGGKVLARDPDDKKIITKVRIDEISLVDRPSNPEARFDVWKAAGASTEDTDMAKNAAALKVVEVPAEAAVGDVAKVVPAAVAEVEGKVGADGKVVEVKPAPEVVVEDAAKAAGAAAAADPVATALVDPNAPGGSAADPVAVSDPLAKATAALDKIDASVTKVNDLKKDMYSVGRMSDILQSLSYVTASAQYESDAEGDNSPVPAKLRDWLKAGAAIFKDMAKEEVDELVSSVSTKKAAAAEDLAKAAGLGDVAKITTERDDLAKRLAERDDQLTKLADRIEPIAKTVEALAEANVELTKRLANVEESPAPAKTAGAHAVVTKEQDVAGGETLNKSAEKTDLENGVTEALQKMNPEDRALLLTKAALALPRTVYQR